MDVVYMKTETLLSSHCASILHSLHLEYLVSCSFRGCFLTGLNTCFRYRDMDDDDECMESSFSRQLREEFVSTKMGILEDLEDMEMEKRELARKKKLMMMKRKRL
jgi:hypothetical protein